LLMFGADAEPLPRLAAGSDMVSQLLDRRDRGRIGVSGVGHVVPRRGGLSFMVLAAIRRLQQREPNDAGGLGPQNARAQRYGCYKGMRADRVKLCGGEASLWPDQQSGGSPRTGDCGRASPVGRAEPPAIRR